MTTATTVAVAAFLALGGVNVVLWLLVLAFGRAYEWEV